MLTQRTVLISIRRELESKQLEPRLSGVSTEATCIYPIYKSVCLADQPKVGATKIQQSKQNIYLEFFYDLHKKAQNKYDNKTMTKTKNQSGKAKNTKKNFKIYLF